MSIDIKNVSKTFGSFAALRDVSFEVRAGELVALLGPSGCGKTTLLRIVAGLETAHRGTVLFDGQDAAGRQAGERRVGFVFQHYALFRHMTFRERRIRSSRAARGLRPSGDQITGKVTELLKLVQSNTLAIDIRASFPVGSDSASRWRVRWRLNQKSSARRAVGALDAKVRQELRRWLRRLHEEIISPVFVTTIRKRPSSWPIAS